MIGPEPVVVSVAGLVIVLVFIGLLVWFTRKWLGAAPASVTTSEFRAILTFDKISQALRKSVEGGELVHYSLGGGALFDDSGAAGLAGLAGLSAVVTGNALTERPTIATVGDGVLGLLDEQVQQQAFKLAGASEDFDPTTSQVIGLTPFSYAVGAAQIAVDTAAAHQIMIGNYGSEAALISDGGARAGSENFGGTTSLTGQAVIAASCDGSILGEEVFASAAYLNGAAWQTASLKAQDVLRWLFILAILAGVVIDLLRAL